MSKNALKSTVSESENTRLEKTEPTGTCQCSGFPGLFALPLVSSRGSIWDQYASPCSNSVSPFPECLDMTVYMFIDMGDIGNVKGYVSTGPFFCGSIWGYFIFLPHPFFRVSGYEGYAKVMQEG